VHAGLRDVQPRADEPRRPLDATRAVEHLVPRSAERDAEIVDHGTPEAVGLID
jgi:hypothetical protein